MNRELVSQQLKQKVDEAYPFREVKSVPSPFAQIDPVEDNDAWVIMLYKKILGKETDKYDSGVRNWLFQLNRNILNRQQIEQEFRKVAAQQQLEINKKNQFDALKEDKSKKILYVMPASERDLFLSSALFRSLKELYPDYKLYVATNPQFAQVLDANPYVDRVITYSSEMDNLAFLEGIGQHEGFFSISYLPFLISQRAVSSIHNGIDKIAF